MGQVLHGCARTTEAVRRAVRHGQASLRDSARRHGVNPKTIAQWRAIAVIGRFFVRQSHGAGRRRDAAEALT